jgi:hypothetical protein
MLRAEVWWVDFDPSLGGETSVVTSKPEKYRRHGLLSSSATTPPIGI